ncbi:MAG: FkbM family methyltransferase [Limisphaerales bacterium]
MQNDLPPQTRTRRLHDYFITLGFALKHGGSLSAGMNLFYLAKLKTGLVYRNLARFNTEKVCCLPFRVTAGKTWNVHVRDNGQDAPMLVEFFDNDRLAEMERLKWKPKVIYDLGANIGIASLSLAALCPDARIYGFEPVPANFEICSLNYSNLANAEVFNCAVGSASGTMSFEITNDPRGGHLATNTSTGIDKKMEVGVWTIADLVEIKGLPPPDFLKVDVEGAELDVLNGLATYANGIKYMHIETHSTELRNECVRWLDLNGFKIEEEFHFAGNLGALWVSRLETDLSARPYSGD